MPGTVDARLKELGIELPQAAVPVASYIPFVISGNLVFVSGQLPFRDGEVAYSGKVGGGISLEDGQAAARLCGLNLIAQVRNACGGNLDRVTRVVRLGGFVNCAPDFTDQPQVINGASDLMMEVFGEAGKHARAAVGAPSLPRGAAVEVDGVFEVSG